MGKKTYIVESPLRFNGRDYAPGKEVALEDEDAQPLLDTRPPVVKEKAGARKDEHKQAP